MTQIRQMNTGLLDKLIRVHLPYLCHLCAEVGA